MIPCMNERLPERRKIYGTVETIKHRGKIFELFWNTLYFTCSTNEIIPTRQALLAECSADHFHIIEFDPC